MESFSGLYSTGWSGYIQMPKLLGLTIWPEHFRGKKFPYQILTPLNSDQAINKSAATLLLYLGTPFLIGDWIETESKKAGLFRSGTIFPKLLLLVPNSSLNCQINWIQLLILVVSIGFSPFQVVIHNLSSFICICCLWVVATLQKSQRHRNPFRTTMNQKHDWKRAVTPDSITGLSANLWKTFQWKPINLKEVRNA